MVDGGGEEWIEGIGKGPMVVVVVVAVVVVVGVSDEIGVVGIVTVNGSLARGRRRRRNPDFVRFSAPLILRCDDVCDECRQKWEEGVEGGYCSPGGWKGEVERHYAPPGDSTATSEQIELTEIL